MKLVPDVHDRIAEAYYGKMGEDFAHATRARIHWICSQVSGKRILDVGCSQGITAILLGREGHSVIGIDVAQRSIKEARDYLAQEPPWVQANIEFWNEDFLAGALDSQVFDTIILGEVLEHLTRPEAFLEAAARRLPANGKLIVTVPFGINDWPDHKQTFYLMEPWRLLSERFEIVEVKLFGRWIGFVARLRGVADRGESVLPGPDLLAAFEASVHDTERRLVSQVDALSRQVAALQAEQAEAGKTLHDRLAQVDAARHEAARTSEELRRQLDEARQALASLSGKAEASERALAEERARRAAEAARIEQERREFAARLALAERSRLELGGEIEALRSRLQEDDERRIAAGRHNASIEAAVARLTAELERTREAYGDAVAQRSEAEQFAGEMAERLIAVCDQLNARSAALEDLERDIDGLKAQAGAKDGEIERLLAGLDAASSISAGLRRRLEAQQEREEAAQARANALLDRLEAAEARERAELARSGELRRELQQAAAETAALRKELEAAAAGNRSEQTKGEELRRELQQASTRAMALRNQLDAAQLQKALAEQRAERAKETISFQIGHAFLEATRSWRGAWALPRRLIEIDREARRRKNKNANKPDKSSVAKLPAPGLPLGSGVEKEVVAGAAYTVSCDIVDGNDPIPDKALIARIDFLDAQGNITQPRSVTGLSNMRSGGFYKYLPTSAQKRRAVRFDFIAPGQAVRAKVRFDRWKLIDGAVSVTNFDLRRKTENSTKSQLELDTSIEGWPVAPSRSALRILGVMDEFTTECFRHDAHVTLPRPDNWQALLDSTEPHFVFIESAWRGNQGSWQYRVGKYAYSPGSELDQLCRYARSRSIPIVFWNKEDPVHHERFLDAARKADFIFTTDANMVPSYKAKLAHDRVSVLQFAAQPSLHVPRGLSGRRPIAAFAGSWYGDRHKERGEDMRWLLNCAVPFGLEIYDRNFGTGNFEFPENLRPCVVGALPYPELCQRYRDYRLFLNVNSVKDSPTMFSRRVFELLACGTPVISTYSKGIEDVFGTETVRFVSDAASAQRALRELLEDDEAWRRYSLRGIRQVFAKHTYAHRIQQLAAHLDLRGGSNILPKLAIVSVADHDTARAHLQSVLASQTYKNAAGIVLTRATKPVEEHSHFRVVAKDQLAAALKDFDYVWAVDGRKTYSCTDLEDLVNATRYAPDADEWAKAASRKAEFCYSAEAQPFNVIQRVDRFLATYPHTENTHASSSGRPAKLYCIQAD